MFVEQVQEHFGELGARFDEVEFGKAFQETCVPKLEAGFAENFAKQSTAGGDKWPARKDPRPQHPLLNLSGKLLASVTTSGAGHVERVEQRSLELGTNIVYAATHEFGDPSRNISQRSYLDVTDPVLDECEAALADHFEQYVFGGVE